MNLKEIAQLAGKAALSSVSPQRLIKENLRREGRYLFIGGDRIDLDKFERINLISFGKAGKPLAENVLALIEDKLQAGVVTGTEQYEIKDKLSFYPAAHPLPDAWSLEAGKKAYELALSSSERDLLLVLISGGGSAHLCLPDEGLTLEDKRAITELLLKAGADIKELNTVRKHLSRIKGGRLAKAAWPAKVVNLVVSDVIGNDLENIASGPTWWDSSTYAQALAVLERTGIMGICPESVKKILTEGTQGWREETVKKGDKVLKNVNSFIIGDNLKALYAAKEEVRKFGLETIILTSTDSGEAREAARKYVQQLLEFGRKVQQERRAFCLLAGGELTVTVRGSGKGGRNTEFVLACLVEISRQWENFKGCDWLVMSLATDGRDGPTDAAGAWIAPESLEKIRAKNILAEDFLKNNDSYRFFQEIGGLLFTGPTGTNVMDLRLFLLAPKGT
ncbi:MAG: glycerate kinase [Candidatus Aminicenantes bacterium]|nr:glycerate kinase [Candidatus Aminicenantes bacterium]